MPEGGDGTLFLVNGGDGGGRIVAEGTPRDVAKVKASFTGQYLKKVIK